MGDVRVDRLADAFDRVHPRLWRALRASYLDADLASDACAEAYAQAAARSEAIDHLDAWLWRAAFRIAAGEAARRRDAGLTALPPDRPSFDDEPAGELLEALAQLSERQRHVIVLRHVGGFTAVEIADRLGTSDASVRVSLHRARRRLRTLLEHDHD